MNKTQDLDKTVFSDGLKAFIKRCELDEKIIAKQCDVSTPLVYNWLNGRNVPTYRSLQKLSHLGMLPNEMFSLAGGGDVDADERKIQIENLDQKTVDEIRIALNGSTDRYYLFQLKTGYQKSFNELEPKEKLKLLHKILDYHFSVLDSINDIIEDVIKDF